jgi:hypothetical protein
MVPGYTYGGDTSMCPGPPRLPRLHIRDMARLDGCDPKHQPVILSSFIYPSPFHMWYWRFCLRPTVKTSRFRGRRERCEALRCVGIPVDSWPLAKNLSNQLGIRHRHSRFLVSKAVPSMGGPMGLGHNVPRPHGRHFRGFEAGSDQMEALLSLSVEG